MGGVTIAGAFDLVLAVAVVAAAVALGAAAAAKLAPRALVAITAVAGAAAVAAAVAAGAAVLVRRAALRAAQIDAHFEEARSQLQALIEREAAERAAELERTLARARADSTSLLIAEERRLTQEHRDEFAERERTMAGSLTEALTATQALVEQRLAGWSQDLDRVRDGMKAHIAELSQRQKQLVSEAELRIAADA